MCSWNPTNMRVWRGLAGLGGKALGQGHRRPRRNKGEKAPPKKMLKPATATPPKETPRDRTLRQRRRHRRPRLQHVALPRAPPPRPEAAVVGRV